MPHLFKFKKLWQQQQLSWSQKLQILFPTWFPEVHMHISNTICNYPEFQHMIEGSSLKHKYFKQDLLHYLRGRKTLRVWFGYSKWFSSAGMHGVPQAWIEQQSIVKDIHSGSQYYQETRTFCRTISQF